MPVVERGETVFSTGPLEATDRRLGVGIAGLQLNAEPQETLARALAHFGMIAS